MTYLAGLFRRLDLSAAAEQVVLSVVLVIAAMISYTHLREVWIAAEAPWPDYGPLLVDGLFAAAWLRIRRRRLRSNPVGVLAWLAIFVALVATLAGNIASAVVTGHIDPLALVVAGWPALAFALVWELVTGHGRAEPPAAPLTEEEREGLEVALQIPVRVRYRADLTTHLYRLYDIDDELLYIGITAALQTRMIQHRRTKIWWSEVVRVVVETYTTRAEALIVERDAILAEEPVHNRKPGSSTDHVSRSVLPVSEHRGPVAEFVHPVPSSTNGPVDDLEMTAMDQELDDELLPAVQDLADSIGRRPTRQAVRDLTGVGATRADRLRNAVTVRTNGELVRTAATGPDAQEATG